jgi:catechol 2,3-dioxygenase-like lactoylglutathione lyase family enzyme
VVCTVGQIHDEPLSKYATVTDQTFSEIASVRAPVSDRAPALEFYGETLRLQTLRSHETVTQGVLLRSVDFLTGSMTPRIQLMDYSPRPSTFRSLRDRSVLPHRGLQALRFSVPSVDAVARAAAAAGVEITAPPAETLLFPQGRVRSILIRAPHGVLHHFTETLRA